MKKAILLFILSFIPFLLHAQTYNMGNNTVTNASGTIYDSGGPNGNYGNNQNFVFTICPSEPLNCLNLTFNSFNLENNYDYLTVYAGTSTNAPILGIYTGTNIPNVVQTSTDCLTLQFTSDGSVIRSGFSATWGEGECPPILEEGGEIPPCPDANIAANDTTVCPGACVDLEVEITPTAITTSYLVENIAYEPLPFNLGTVQNVPVDDTWSSVVNMNFNFCFYGNTYNQLVVGTNGLISFNTNYANQNLAWVINTPFPSNNNPINSIAAPYHDIDPAVGGIMRYGTSGEAPCRSFIITWQNVPMFSGTCNNLLATQQIILYETSNIIETYIENKPLCPSWNSGAAIHGIQNANGTQAAVVPGRNYPTQWTASNDGKRFRPNGTPTHDVTWYENGTTPIGNNETITVCPTEETLYTAEVIYTNCDGSTIIANDEVNVITTEPFEVMAIQNDVSCSTGNNGSITVAPSGGSGNYSYNWSNFQTTPTINNLGAGTYIVTITDNATPTCPRIETYTIDLSPPLIANIVSTDAICDGATGGSIDLTVLGGTTASGNYNYNWSGGLSNQQDHNNVVQGNYTVTVTDDNGCTATAATLINASPGLTINLTANEADCGLSNGSLDLSINGGTPFYTYDWNDNSLDGTQSPINLASGTYSVTVTDINDCSDSASVTINDNPAPMVSIVGTDANCGLADGEATATAQNGTASYTYLWNTTPPQNTATATNLASGTYSVTVTDANACTIVGNITINDSASPTVSATPTTANCGLADGSATVMASNGTPPYTYEWNTNPIQNTATATNLASGTYSVTVTDDIGCTAETTVTIGENPPPTATTDVLDANCGLADGEASVTVSGGTPPYTYEWNTNPIQNTANIGNIVAGTYNVTVTDTNDCTVVASATIGENPAPTIDISSTDASCGEDNGSISAIANGGTPPYTYAWLAPINSANTTISNVAAGNYSVLLTDDNGCTATANVTVGDSPNPTVSVSTTDATCGDSNGSAMANANGGTPPYSYEWSSSISSNSATANNLDAGNYSVTVSDANDCMAVATFAITNTPPLDGNIDTEDAHCGLADGTATASASGGTPPYFYEWSSSISSNSATANNLTAGNYSLTITDDIGCSIVLPIIINDIPGPTATTSSTDATCGEENGEVSISVLGGLAPYTYEWSITPPQSTSVVSNVSVGNYSVTVTDANDCTLVENVSVIDLGSPTATTSSTDATCNETNGSIMVSATGGNPPYSYLWNTTPTQNTPTINNLDAGDYEVTVTDANNCNFVTQVSIINTPAVEANISNENANCGEADGTASIFVTNGTPPYNYLWNDAASQNTAIANNLVTGNYTVTVTDEIGCTLSLNVNVGDNPPPTVSATFENSICDEPNGSAEAIGQGGQGVYTYFWNTIPPQNTAIANNLLAGTYIVTITDEVGCTASTSVTLIDAGIPTASLTTQNATCGDSNGLATATASGGTPPYSYEWNTTPLQTTQTITDLAPNTYIVTVTDDLGCTNTAQVNVIDNSAPTSQISGIDPTCELENGSATIIVSGGLLPYNYLWNDDASQNTATANNLAFGTYSVTVTDGNGCIVTNTITLNESQLPSVVLNNIDASCGLANGEIFAEASGGMPPYSYLWNDDASQNTATANNLDIGTYAVTITDDIGCTISAETTLNGTTAPTVNTDFVTATCSEANGIATALATGGQPPYSFTWSSIPVQNNETATNLAEGIYSVTITDSNNCTASQMIEIPNIPAPTADITPQNANCGEANGSATVNVNGNTAPYIYEWNTTPTQTTPTANNLLAGNYEVIITDANDCNTIVTIDIIDTGSPIIDELIATDPICDEPNGIATVSVSGGTPPYIYEWNTTPIQTNPTATNLGEGIFTINVTDFNGCLVSSNITLTNTPSPTAQATATLSSCAAADGSATVVANGGTPPYTYEWNTTPTQFTDVAMNLGQGSYTATVTDALGCTTTAQTSVTVPPSPTLTTTYTPDECAASIATATVTVSGGSTPYSYTWDDLNTQNTQTATNLIAGIYYVTVTDAVGCSAVENIVIDGTTPPTIDFGTINENCGQANGEAAALPSGGLPPYTYLWNTFPTQGNNIIVNLVAGDYTVTVTDANGCTAIETTTILDEGAPVVEILDFNNPACGVENGEATVSITQGGTPPFSYEWNTNPIQTTETITDLPAGTYSVTITDDISCTASAEIVLTSPNAPTVQMSILPTTCSQDNGSATAIVTGGEPPFLYFWSVAGTPTNVTSVENIPPGPYTFSVVDGNGCNIASSFIIDESESPAVVLSAQTTICGQNNGSASAVVSGGNPPYSYEWNTSPIQFTTDISDLAAGNYNVTITDANGCSTSDNIDIAASAGPTIDEVTTINSNCNQADGSANVIVSGGTGNITYLWENGDQTANISNLLAGSYGVTVLDDLGCSVAASATVSDDGAPTAEISGINPTCNEANGSASVVVTGGSNSYTYVWNNDASLNMPDLTNVAAGEHTVVVTDINGCIVTASVEITDNGVPTANIEPTATLCGLNNGSATAIVEFGTPPYTYLWSENNQQTESIESLAAGEYYLTITDAIACTATASTSVESSEELQVVTDGIAATCGEPNGEAAAIPINGQVPHTYFWENGFVTSIATGLFAGNYSVTITDANSCSTSVIVNVNEILPPILSTNSIDATCNLSNGSISISINEGTPPFSYLWNDASQQTSETSSNLAAGNYTVTVTDNNNCEVIISESIANIETPTATLAFTEATCGNSNATVTVTTLSGIPPFTYAWNVSNQTTETITEIAPSLVSVTVTDANSCTFVEQINVTSENSPTATITDFVSPTCGNANGAATVLATDGMPPYSYVWNSNPLQNASIANGLAAGNYIVTVTDGNGCVATANVDLVNIAGPTISLSATNATCQQANGTAMVSVNGGTEPFIYLWNDANAQMTTTAIDLPSGNYSITVTDANDCSTVENINIGDSDIPNISITTANASCGQNDGQATASGLNGVPPYSFVWDANANNQTTEIASNLFAGAYTVTITDANGCQNTDIANIIDENAPSANTVTTNEICGQGNGTATVTTTGGFPPFTYLWNDANVQITETATNLAAGTYSIAVTDANGCVATATATVDETVGATLEISNTSASCGGNNGTASVVANSGLTPYTYLWDANANNEITASVNNLLSGIYNVTVTDTNGCTASISTTISDTDLPTVSTITTNSVCGQAVGEATAQAANGTPPYTYLWNDENTQIGISATALTAGIYEVTITDDAGCTASASATINDEGSPTLTTTSVMPTCNSANGSASVSVVGNSAPYTYLWNTTPPQFTETATNLAQGTYIVDVTDVNNCLVSIEVILTNIDSPTLSLSSENSTCGDANGTASVTTDGIATPYTYLWSDENAQTTETAINLLAGTYFVTLTDVNNCENVGEIVVENTIGATVSITTVSASCQLANGEATAIPQNGTAPYTYTWNDANEQTTETAINLASGDYEVIITDANGCTSNANTTILDTPIPTVTAVSTNANCGLANGTATATAATGVAPYTYLWDANANTQNTATAIDLAPNTYSVTTTDANDCTAETSVTVGDDGSPTVILAATNPTCELNNGEVTATAANGLPPYNYAWNDANGQTTATAINLITGTYTITVTDANNCGVVESITLTDNGNPTTILSSIASTCGDSNGSATVVATVGTAPYTYVWSDGVQTSETATNLAQGNYIVTVTDANGCEAIESILVENIGGPSATTSSVSATCALADGSATVTAIDGTAPYTYAWNDTNGQITETAVNLPTGIYEVTITDDNDCTFVTEAEVFGFMLSPIINCDESTTSSVTFEWQTVSGAIEYQISIDGNFVETVDASILIYTVTGLSSGQNVEISIVAVGEVICGISEATNQICQSLPCPDIPLIINGLDEVYCDYDENAILSGEPTGGVFSGNGIVGTAFNPSLAGVGVHEINYFYSQDNCQYDTTYVVQISNVTVSTIPSTTVLETPEAVVLDATAISGLGGDVSYEWLPTESLDCSDCESVVATPIESTEYTVVATDEYGCSANSVAFINFDFNNILIIPNAFSPNGDNENDIFRVKGLNIIEVELHIYNRWGQLVFEDKTTDLTQGWDGQFRDEDCEIGVYVFYAIATFVDGSEEFTKGNVTLIR